MYYWGLKNSPFLLPPTKEEVYAIACLSVSLSVSKITQKRVNGYGWNFANRQVLGHGRTGQLFSPIRIIIRMPEPENLKVEDLSKSVKQAPHSEQATGHRMYCREILFTPRCSPRASFPGRSTFLYDVYDCGATGRQAFPIFGFWPLSEVPALHGVPF